MTDVTGDLALPNPTERAARNADLTATGTETGFWDNHGRPAPWPDDIDQWQPDTSEHTIKKPGQPLF
jgi:hypothetical protein